MRAPGLQPFCFDRRWLFPVSPDRFWTVVAGTGDYRSWWPWLRVLDGPLAVGLPVRCEVRSPLPYALRFTVTPSEVTPARRLRATVAGDLCGPARLDLDPRPGGVEVRLGWEVELRRRLLRGAAAVARPAMEWGHDWVVERGVEQFCRQALGVEGVSPPG